MHPPPPLPSCWEVAGKEGVTFFRGGCSFSTHKKKLKSETFNDKKLENFNKNSVTFRRSDGVKVENFNIIGDSLKNPFWGVGGGGGGVPEKTI